MSEGQEVCLVHLEYEYSQHLTSSVKTAVTAAHCAKTLLSAAAAGNIALQHCVKLLIPGIISYLASVAGRNQQKDGGAQGDTQGVEEALKAFAVLFSSFPELSRAFVLATASDT